MLADAIFYLQQLDMESSGPGVVKKGSESSSRNGKEATKDLQLPQTGK